MPGARYLCLVGLVGTAILLASSGLYAAPRVNVMPDGIYEEGLLNMAYAWPGTTLVIWGNVRDGVPPYTYEWDFGDGTPPASGAVVDPEYIAESHTYATTGTRYATLTVTDDNSDSDSDMVRIDVVDTDLSIRASRAIEGGLRYLYLSQAADGSWTNLNNFPVGASGLAILAYETRGHLPGNNDEEDIYNETVLKGMQYILNNSHTVPIGPQLYCYPDTDGDGIGIRFNSAAGVQGYETGISMMALVASGDSNMVASSTSSPDVDGHRYIDIIRDAVDYCAYAQNDDSTARGGWRYWANDVVSDNSVSKWPALGLEAAERRWGVAAPQCVKDELLIWLDYGQNYTHGAFGYKNSNYWLNVAKTASGVCMFAYADVVSSDPRIQKALGYIDRCWDHCVEEWCNIGDPYAMYCVAKGCRISLPGEITQIGSHIWQEEYNAWLVSSQRSDGSWPADKYLGEDTSTALALCILMPDPFGADPTARITDPGRHMPGHSLGPVFPNPAVGGSEIHFGLVAHERVKILVYDVRGRVVTTLMDEALPAGLHCVTWNGNDDSGAPMVSGVYFCRMETSGFKAIHKLLLVH